MSPANPVHRHHGAVLSTRTAIWLVRRVARVSTHARSESDKNVCSAQMLTGRSGSVSVDQGCGSMVTIGEDTPALVFVWGQVFTYVTDISMLPAAAPAGDKPTAGWHPPPTLTYQSRPHHKSTPKYANRCSRMCCGHPSSRNTEDHNSLFAPPAAHLSAGCTTPESSFTPMGLRSRSVTAGWLSATDRLSLYRSDDQPRIIRNGVEDNGRHSVC